SMLKGAPAFQATAALVFMGAPARFQMAHYGLRARGAGRPRRRLSENAAPLSDRASANGTVVGGRRMLATDQRSLAMDQVRQRHNE
ncbi:hypothetical protein, partial [Janthinobacterium sp.]|uniref:hypothetical protein n=1 Tax=Janthinobacterium sp. TaxID=1871054 RepID=UPI0028A2B5CA